jgi:hypothetical protein
LGTSSKTAIENLSLEKLKEGLKSIRERKAPVNQNIEMKG